MNLLKFSPGNAKIKHIPSLSLISGYSCPFALNCLSKADKVTGKITDGKETIFRCFSASQESLFPSVRKQRWYNFNLLRESKTEQAMANLISKSLPLNNRVIRIHVGGDFYSQAYFNAWIKVANKHKDIIFYAYTKAIPYWINRLGSIPNNLKLTASFGGKHDALISQYNLKSAIVVYSELEAKKLKLEIDHDDSHAYGGNKNFALLIHGTQPKGSKAGKSKQLLKEKGWTGYKRAA